MADGLNPEFQKRLQAMVDASGGKLSVVDDYRDAATQADLWAKALKKYNGNEEEARKWVAPPGSSYHEKGLAADLEGDWKWAHDHAAEFGLYFPLPNEDWHVEMEGTRQGKDEQLGSGSAASIVDQSARTNATRPPAPGDPMLWLVNMLGAGDPMFAGNASALPEQSLFDQALTTARPGAPQTAQAAQGGPAPVEGTYEAWIAEIARQKGLTAEETAAFRQLGLGESGGQNIWQQVQDVNMDNGDPAFGPWQVIGSTFDQYKEPGHGDRFNPIDSGLASINYQRARYGRVLSEAGY